MQRLHTCFRFLLSGALAFVLASMFHTQSVLMKLSQLDISISLQQKVESIGVDLLGLAPTYGIVVLVGLAIAFILASQLNRLLLVPKTWIYAVAGGLAMAVILLAMKPILNVTLLAGARELGGFLLQCLAGTLGGLVFGITAKTQND